MRIISGSAKGRKLIPVPGESTRPITDRVKEALFNVIGADIRDARFLDLFAGTGSVGIEALSRGASTALFLDINKKAINTIRANLERTGLVDRAQIMQGSAFSLLSEPAANQFDYIYIAPPQYKGMWKRTLEELDAHHDWLTDDAWVIVQIHPKEITPIELHSLKEFDRRQYGSTLLLFFTLQS
jgi:16S rRNA (guanine(966)-N(2))-methyltransferase RsmD